MDQGGAHRSPAPKPAGPQWLSQPTRLPVQVEQVRDCRWEVVGVLPLRSQGSPGWNSVPPNLWGLTDQASAAAGLLSRVALGLSPPRAFSPCPKWGPLAGHSGGAGLTVTPLIPWMGLGGTAPKEPLMVLPHFPCSSRLGPFLPTQGRSGSGEEFPWVLGRPGGWGWGEGARE